MVNRFIHQVRLVILIGSQFFEKLGLKYRRMYLMRHTFISLMISYGEDILWVSKNVGHKDLSITLKEYARYINDGDKKRATFLVDIY